MAGNDFSRHRAFYSDIAAAYHGLRYETRYGRLFRHLHHQVLRQALAPLPSGATVLEVACGTGHTTALLQELGLDCVACDLTLPMIHQARARLGGGRFVAADALRLPYRDGTFQAVVSTRFLHLFRPAEQRQLLREMTRVLMPGGLLVVDFDNFTSRWLLAVPHLVYNLLRYRRFAPEAHYNRIPTVERTLRELSLIEIQSYGVAGYHLILPALFSEGWALRLGAGHRSRPWRFLAEQFVSAGTKAL